METVDSLLGVARLPLLRHGIGKRTLERDQLMPVDLRLTRDAAAAHPSQAIGQLGRAGKHSLGITAPERAGPAERTMVDDSDAPAGGPHRRSRCTGGYACSNDDEIVAAAGHG